MTEGTASLLYEMYGGQMFLVAKYAPREAARWAAEQTASQNKKHFKNGNHVLTQSLVWRGGHCSQ